MQFGPRSGLTDFETDNEAIAHLQAVTIPAITDGWLVVKSDLYGRGFFAIHTEDADAAIAETFPAEVEICGDLLELYYQIYTDVWTQALAAPGPHPNAVQIPVPSADGLGLLRDRSFNDLPFPPLFIPEPEAAEDD